MFNNLINTIPPITRIQLISMVLLNLLSSTEAIARSDFYFNIGKILEGEIWRLFTSLFIVRSQSFIFCIELYFLYLSNYTAITFQAVLKKVDSKEAV